MKKLIAAGLLSLAALGTATAPAPAWLFDHCCYSKCTLKLACRQYNAFTPFCCGNMSCVGCCPFGGGGQPYCTPAPPPPPMPWGQAAWGDGCCPSDFGGGQLPPPGSYTMLPQTDAAQAPNFTPPMPNPADNKGQTSVPTSKLEPVPAAWNMVQPTGFYPPYNYNYPMGYYPQNLGGYNPAAYPGYGYGQPMMPAAYRPSYGSQWNAFTGN